MYVLSLSFQYRHQETESDFLCPSLSRHVAIKIKISEQRHDNKEVKILEKLASGPAGYPGRYGITQLQDHFELVGPNGRHLCLVLEALGSCLQRGKYSPEGPWYIAKQLVQTIAYCHAAGIIHGSK